MERERSSAQGWRSVSIVLAGAFMALLDTTIVNVALPTIRSGLHAPASTLEWIVSGYALAYGLALVPAGRAGDRFGQKPMFVGGLTVFTLASVACGISQTPAEIVTARVIQGLGAGTFYPAISATIQLAFTGPARSKAFGMLGAVIGVSTALGPTLGGLIIAAAGSAEGWRWVFLVNLFIGAVAIPLAVWQLPRGAVRGRRGFDPPGLALLTAALLLLLIPLVEGQQAGWPAWCWACLAAAVVTFAGLAAWEVHAGRGGGDPLLEPALFRQKPFSVGVAFAAVYFAGFTTVFFTMSILWQEGLGHGALITGLVLAPFSIGSLLASANSDKLSARLGRSVLVVGTLVVLVGLAATAVVIHLTAPEPDGWYLVAPLFVAGLGSGVIIAPNTDFVLKAVPPRDAGTASGILGTFQRTGTAIGIAVIGSVLFGTLKIHPGPHAVASAFSHSAELALWVNLGVVALSLVLALASRMIVTAAPAVPDSSVRSS